MRRKNTALCFLLCFSLEFQAHAKPARILRLSESAIADIHTAVGYSTILQFDSRPASVVIGDQDSFKVEYLGNSITIKPTSAGVRTNMFVYTDYDRFSFRLVTGRADAVDYLVEIRKEGKRRESDYSDFNAGTAINGLLPELESAGLSMKKTTIGKTTFCSGISLTVDSVSRPRNNPWLLLSFSIGSDREIDFVGTDLFLTLGKKKVGFETLYLESTHSPGGTRKTHGHFLLHEKSEKAFEAFTLNFSPAVLSKEKCKLFVKVLPNSPKEETGESKNR